MLELKITEENKIKKIPNENNKFILIFLFSVKVLFKDRREPSRNWNALVGDW